MKAGRQVRIASFQPGRTKQFKRVLADTYERYPELDENDELFNEDIA